MFRIKISVLPAVLVMIISFLSFTHVTAQNTALHLDKSFYVNGEVIWYKLYLPADFSGKEVAVRTSLHDANGKEVSYTFHNSDANTQINGYYKVPFDLATGYYQLTFRVLQEMERTTGILANQVIPIYNDNDIRELEKNLEDVRFEQAPASPFGDLRVSLSLEDTQPGVRAENTLTISVQDAAGNPVSADASVAVTNWTLTAPALGEYAGVVEGEAGDALQSEGLISQVYKLTQIVDESGNPRIASVIGAWSGSERKMYFSSRTNPEGVSLLKQPEFTGEKVIQYLGYDKEAADILTRDIVFTSPAVDRKLAVTPGLLNYLQKSQQRKKIFQYYGKLEFDLDITPRQLERAKLKGDQVFRVDEYQAFDNFATFFQENLSPLRFGEDRENNRYTTYMYNPRNNRNNKRLPGNPLFIVDGKVTRDADFVGRLDLEQVNTVQLFFRPETLRSQFNVMGANGVVTIEMSGEDQVQLPSADEANRYRISGLQRPASFPAFDPADIPANQPFFRPQLFWEPSIAIDGDGQGRVSFYQSDARDTFRVEVMVQDSEGRRGYQTLIYEAGNNQ